MVSAMRRLAGNAHVFWTVTTLTCISQIALIAITIGLATNNASINGSIHRTAWVTAAGNMIAFTASLGAVCLYVRRTTRTVYFILYAAFIVLSILAAMLTIYTLTWIWSYVRGVKHSNRQDLFTQNLATAGFAVWTIALLVQATLFTLVFWPKQDQIASPQPQELTPRISPGRSVKRRLSDLTSLTPPSSPPFVPSTSGSSSQKFPSPPLTPKSSLGQLVSPIRPMTSKTKLLLRQSSFPRDSSSLNSTRETSLETLRQDDGFESWDTSGVGDPDDGHFLPRSTRTRLETIPGSRPVSPANPLNGPFPDLEDDVRLPDSPLHSPIGSPSSDTSSFRFSPPPTRPGSSAGQSHIHPLFRSESPVPPPVASPGTVITASPFAGQVVNPENHPFVPRKLHSSHSGRVECSSPLSPPRSRQSSFRSIQQFTPEQRPNTAQSSRLALSPEPEDFSV